jgi:hypothetical protein
LWRAAGVFAFVGAGAVAVATIGAIIATEGAASAMIPEALDTIGTLAVLGLTAFAIANEIDKKEAVPPNGGVGPQHGNPDHDKEINDKAQELLDAGYTNVRKNQQQVDDAGNVVGTNRPDLQGTSPEGVREYWEFDRNLKNAKQHVDKIKQNDPNGVVHSEILQ